MQGEAMTVEAARKTPFEVLVVVSSNGTSAGQLFLDDGEQVEMGNPADSKNWTFVKFEGGITGNGTLFVKSAVENGEFALNQGWIIDTVNFIGLKQGNFVENKISMRRGLGFKSSLDDNNGQFFDVQVSGLSLPVGKEFNLEHPFS